MAGNADFREGHPRSRPSWDDGSLQRCHPETDVLQILTGVLSLLRKEVQVHMWSTTPSITLLNNTTHASKMLAHTHEPTHTTFVAHTHTHTHTHECTYMCAYAHIFSLQNLIHWVQLSPVFFLYKKLYTHESLHIQLLDDILWHHRKLSKEKAMQ